MSDDETIRGDDPFDPKSNPDDILDPTEAESDPIGEPVEEEEKYAGDEDDEEDDEESSENFM